MNLREQRLWLEAHPGIPLDEALSNYVTFNVESFIEAAQEASVHFQDHHEEAGDGRPLDPDFRAYFLMERLDTLQFVTARADGKIVGYHMAVLSPSLKHRGTLVGTMDMFYLLPIYRRGLTGYKLISYAIDRLIDRGVKEIIASVKDDHASMFDRLGFRPSERVYLKEV